MSEILSLASHPVFASLSEQEQEAVYAAGFPRKYRKGSYIAMAGEIWPYLFLVIRGKVSAVKVSSEGRSLLISSIEAGDIFWGLAFFHPDVGMPVSLEAIEESCILLWERERFLPFLLNNGALSWELSRMMVTRMLRASDIVEGLAFQPVAGRVARFLLEQTPEDLTTSPRHLTLDQMAAHIGTTREMVCRYLRTFSDEGLIDITRTEYQITDRERLMKLSSHVKG